MDLEQTLPATEGRIRVLPSQLADQIAAGEVVERPASVVKELVENALDAGARRVDVDVEGGGRRMIRVVDDGCGMTAADARLALRRHATSKLTSLEDLFDLHTMGFRGEALPSIAAVSRLTLTTRPPGTVEGVRLLVEGGVERDSSYAGAPVGTQLEVRDLLWNVPARLKFLKAEPTEAAHVTEAVTRLALAHPSVHLRLRHGGRVVLDLPPHVSALERVRAVAGRRLGARLFEAEGAEAGVTVRVFLAPPDEAQTTSRGLALFVGKRFVRDRGLLHAVVMGYGELVPQGRYPTAFVFVDPPPGSVDVNVHPQKTEVRFSHPQEVFAAVRHTVARALAGAPWVQAGGETARPLSMYAVASPAPPARLSEIAHTYADRQADLLEWKLRPPAREDDPAPTQVFLPPAPLPEPSRLGFFGSLRYLGQIDRTFLVCEAAGEMVLIDQHAAHERIAFQRLREGHAAGGPRTQRLLFPRTLDLDEPQAAAAEEHRAALEGIGFDLEPFGTRSFALKAAPVDLRDEEVVPTLLALLDDLGETQGSGALEERVDHMLATVACHSVVRAGDLLSEAEARALLEAMDGVDYRAHCPHGRPVLLRVPVAEIARRFGR
jgi:DNA mismatch repair protein MutL